MTAERNAANHLINIMIFIITRIIIFFQLLLLLLQVVAVSQLTEYFKWTSLQCAHTEIFQQFLSFHF